ncbi:MAG: signal peptidase II [Bdellovibrionota bacterium]|nr:signal peptidase II [Bdellovibrionota bacterium]
MKEEEKKITKLTIIFISLFFGLIFLDQFTKLYLHSVESLGIFKLAKNHGIFLGKFRNIPQSLKLTSILIFNFSIILILGSFFYFLTEKLLKLKYGVFFLLIGILGNTLDRVYLGYVIDFIPLSTGRSRFFYNIADIYQIIGAATLIISLLTGEAKKLWPDKEQRTKFWIGTEIQKHFLLSSLIPFITFGFFFLILEFLSLSLLFHKSFGSQSRKANEFIMVIFVPSVALFLLFSILFSLIIVYYSHKISGPLYRFQKETQNILEDKKHPEKLKFRDNDKLLKLEKLFLEIKDYVGNFKQ